MKTDFMDIRIQPWDEINPEEIARFTLQTRRNEGLATNTANIDTYLTAIQWWTNRKHSTPIIAYDGDRMVGWLVFFSFIPTTSTIGRWHPIVESNPQKDEIAQQLLQASINHAKKHHFERLEAELVGITAENETWYKRYQTWYKTLGFFLASEEARLEKELIEHQPPPELPPEFEFHSIDHFTNEELESSFFEMFDNSKDRFWLHQTNTQRKETYEFWFDRERPFVEEATAVLTKNEEIIGLTVVRPVQEAGMLGPIAIAPKYRRRGLARTLMQYSLRGAKHCGITRIQLEFDITNEPAMNLYKELGFTHVHRLAIFSLTL
ncbi:MAG: GNAT family N-acetyltransferase [Promethearchaeota archaeon]